MTPDIALVLAVLAVTILLFVTEVLRVDVIAITIMVMLPWLGLIQPQEAFSGLASNAVVAVMGVMILSHGLDHTGVIRHIVRPILRVAGKNERRITALVSGAAAIISSLMQNIGAAALLLPALLRISKKTRIPVSRLLMPMGYVAILGGTLTLVGSGPLIILNDLLGQAGEEPYGLFSVTPIGLALVVGGIVYFLILGRTVLPTTETVADDSTPSRQRLPDIWELPQSVHHGTIPAESTLVGQTRESAQLWSEYGLHLLSIRQDHETTQAPWRFSVFEAGQEVQVLGPKVQFNRFVQRYGLTVTESGTPVDEAAPSAGFAEIVIPPRSRVQNKTIRELALRNTYRVEPLLLMSGDKEYRDDFSDVPLSAGDALVVHGPYQLLVELGDSPDFALVTAVDEAGQQVNKPIRAVLCTLGAIGLALSGAHLSVSLFSGAVAMVLLGVLRIDEAYKAVDWRTVFLLAGLIPLGMAMDPTGGAEYVASALMNLPHGGNAIVILTGVAILATVFSLFMSNVAATVLLVPLVVAMGQTAGISPRALALLVGVSASNSFILPTHQVNALLMGPGGYHNKDYLRAGSLMSVLFIVIVVALTYIFYL
ncbi:MAG: SLC13 family permease [Kiritimatiellae bacterium]|nr:SLC13 family permease [Kiritimatiellia bacterium]